MSDFTWSPDGAQIAFLAPAPKPDGKSNAADENVRDRDADLDRLWLVPRRAAGPTKARQLTTAPFRIDEIAWPKMDRLLAVATDHPLREARDTAVYSVSLTDGRFTPFAHPPQPFEDLTASPHGIQLAFRASATKGPTAHDLFTQDTASGDARDLTRSVDRHVQEARWQDDATIVARVVDGFHSVLYRVGRQPSSPTRIDLPLSVRAFDVARDGTLAFVGVGFDHLPELYTAPRDPSKGGAKQLGHLQDEAWSHIPLVNGSLFRFKSFDGTEIEAALLKPPPSAPAAPAAGRPLVLLVHGGPSGSFSADYFWFNAWAQLLAARGYDVLLVNPRGSLGYGEAFVKANRADWGGGDYKDLLAALDHVQAGGGVNPQRLGIGGWSYGGEMTDWAIGHTNRFKAAVSGASVFDQAAEFETEDGPEGDEWHFGTPWDNPDVFARNSPVSFIKNAKTPTLIVHGDADHNNPLGQSLGLYRALKHLGVEDRARRLPR